VPHNSQRDPSYSYELDKLLAVDTPDAPEDFDIFWHSAYREIINLRPKVTLRDTQELVNNWRVLDVKFTSTDNVIIGGWLLVPVDKAPTHGLIVGHGYGGRHAPDFNLPFRDAAIFFPCCRGLGKSPAPPISSDPQWHILHDIDQIDRYIIKGCVEDTWLSVSCMEIIFPYLTGKLGYLGVSLTGGIGVLAMACEERIAKAHFNVPTFGHHRIRLRQPTWGSGKAVQKFFRKHPKLTLNTLRYYDSANAAEAIKMPTHFALALKDPVVTPPGQFAIYNKVKANKQLFVLTEGHAHYAEQHHQEQLLLKELEVFFSTL
jgi:cephalosporin-C deacetylase